MKTNTAHILVCDLAAFGDSPDASAPSRFLVLKFGRNDYTKGDQRGSFDFTEADGRRILSDFAERGKELVVDYDHQSLEAGAQAPAAGWIRSLELTDRGLECDVCWTDEGARRLGAREYRYHSPVVYFDGNGHPKTLHSVALTNHPSLHRYSPLVADDNTNKENNNMNEHLKKLAELLAVPTAYDDGKDADAEAAGAIAGRVEALLSFEKSAQGFLEKQGCKAFADVEGKIAGMVPAAEKAELIAKLSGIEAEKAVAAAFADGKLVEAQRDWALKYASENPEAFADFVKNGPRVVPDNKVPAEPKKGGCCKELSDCDKAVLKRMGLSEEEIEKLSKEEK